MTDVNNLSSVFISHVKTLFDILDENHTGFVRLSDIESHWAGNDCVIPANTVIQSLRNVATPSGRLTFDTLIMGLERALAAWKINNSGSHSAVTSSSDSQRSSLGTVSTSTTTHGSAHRKNDTSDSGGHKRAVLKNTAACNGRVKSVDAEYNSGPAYSGANADGMKFRQSDRISARDNGEYVRVQQRRGD